MKKRLVLLFFGLLAGILLVGWVRSRGIEGGEERKGEVEVGEVREKSDVERLEVVIDFGEGELISSSEEIVDKATVYELLTRLLEDKGLDYEVEEYDFGVLVKSIDGRLNSKERAWIYFVNGEAGGVAADLYEVKANDRVEWKYIEPIY